MANITKLQDQITSLRTEARQWQGSAASEILQRVKLGVELERAKLAFLSLRKNNIRLKEDFRKSRKQCSLLRVKIEISGRGLRQSEEIDLR